MLGELFKKTKIRNIEEELQMKGVNLRVINSEGKKMNDGVMYPIFCECGQPLLGGEQLCQQCVREAQIVATRRGEDVRLVEEHIIIPVETKGEMQFYDTMTRSFVPRAVLPKQDKSSLRSRRY